MSALNQENNPWTLDVQDVWNPALEPEMMIRQEFTSIQDFIDSSDMESLPKDPVSSVDPVISRFPDKSSLDGQEVSKVINGRFQQPCEEGSIQYSFQNSSDMENLPKKPASSVDPDISGFPDKSGLEGQEVSKVINGRFKQPYEEGSIQYSFQDFMDSSDMESLPNGAVSPVDPDISVFLDKSGLEGQEVSKVISGHFQQPCEEGLIQYSFQDFMDSSDMESLPKEPASPVDPDKSDFESQKVCKVINGRFQQPCEVGSTQYSLQDFIDDFQFEDQEVEAAMQNRPSPKEFLSPELARISQNGPIYLDSDELQLLEGQEVGACLQNILYAKDFLAPKFAANGPKSPVDPDLDEIHVRFEGREVEAAPKEFLSPEFPVEMPEFENYIPLTPKIFETQEVNMCAGKVQLEPNSCFGPKSILQNNQEIQPVLQNDAKFAMKSESLTIPQMGPEQGK